MHANGIFFSLPKLQYCDPLRDLILELVCVGVCVCKYVQRGIAKCTVYRDESGIETGISW